MSDHDLLVVSRFKNLRLYEEIERYGSGYQLAKWLGVTPCSIYELVNLRRFPYYSTGERAGTLKRTAKKLAEFFDIPAEELFPPELYRMAMHLPKKFERTFSSPELLSLSDTATRALLPDVVPELRDAVNTKGVVHDVLLTLTPREQKVIEMRFGIGDYGEEHTMAEIGRDLGVSVESVSRVEARALRRLRHPTRSRRLWPLLESMEEDQ